MGKFKPGINTIIMTAICAALAIGGAAFAQDTQQPPAPPLGKTQICLRSNGHTEPAVCTVIGSGSSRNDVCRCPKGGTLTDVSICAAGMKPPKEDSAFRAWRAANGKSGSLIGTTYEDKPVCVKRR